jgi:hypothetical protein
VRLPNNESPAPAVVVLVPPAFGLGLGLATEDSTGTAALVLATGLAVGPGVTSTTGCELFTKLGGLGLGVGGMDPATIIVDPSALTWFGGAVDGGTSDADSAALVGDTFEGTVVWGG